MNQPRIDKLVVPLAMCVLLAGCQQEMARQPYYRPLQPSSLFDDGRSARHPVAGTVARGSSEESGLRSAAADDWRRTVAMLGFLPADPWSAAASAADWSLYRDAFPMTVTPVTLLRGQERFNIYCSVCHDRTGRGQGMVVQRGFTAPPSFHTDWSRGFKLKGTRLRLRDAPVGYYFEVVTHGFGAMPDYAAQVPPSDRWAIIAYIRALQLSQHASMAEVDDPSAKDRLLRTKSE